MIIIYILIYSSVEKMIEQPSNKNQQQSTNVVYILCQNFGAQYIQQLTKQLTTCNIPYQLQKDYDYLNVPLNRRYFVIVDNLKGPTKLGSWFSSLLLYIVGFPRKGDNKKNHYCTKVTQVLQKYKEFCTLPQFTVQSYLSSHVTSKSYLKSSKSAISVVSQSKKQSSECSSDIKKQNINQIVVQIKEKVTINEKSKLLLLLSKNDKNFNKWLLKIAANNPKRFQIVQSIQDFILTLSVCKSNKNFLLINENEYEQNQKQVLLSDVHLIVYTKKLDSIDQHNRIIAICRTHNELIKVIRDIGFQVLSLKDIDKSIVKYGNPFANQQKPKSNKKIVWEKQDISDVKINRETTSQKIDGKFCIKVSTQSSSYSLAHSAPTYFRYTDKNVQMKNINNGVKQKKRTSIEQNYYGINNIQNTIKEQPQQVKEQIKQSIQKPKIMKLTKIKKQNTKDIQKVKQEEEEKDKQNQLQNNSKKSQQSNTNKIPLKIKRIKYNKTNTEAITPQQPAQQLLIKKQSITTQANSTANIKKQEKLKIKKITKFSSQKSKDEYLIKSLENESFICGNLEQNHILMNSSIASLALKQTPRDFDMTFPENIDLNFGFRKTNQQQNKQNCTTNQAKINSILHNNKKQTQYYNLQSTNPNIGLLKYKKTILGVQQSQIGLSLNQIRPLYSNDWWQNNDGQQYTLLWKDFSYIIKKVKDQSLAYLRHKIVQNISFCFSSQLRQHFSNKSSQQKLIIFLDQSQLSSYIQVIVQCYDMLTIQSIVVFIDEQKISKNKIQINEYQLCLKNIRKNHSFLQKIIKPYIYKNNQKQHQRLEILQNIWCKTSQVTGYLI